MRPIVTPAPFNPLAAGAVDMPGSVDGLWAATTLASATTVIAASAGANRTVRDRRVRPLIPGFLLLWQRAVKQIALDNVVRCGIATPIRGCQPSKHRFCKDCAMADRTTLSDTPGRGLRHSRATMRE